RKTRRFRTSPGRQVAAAQIDRRAVDFGPAVSTLPPPQKRGRQTGRKPSYRQPAIRGLQGLENCPLKPWRRRISFRHQASDASRRAGALKLGFTGPDFFRTDYAGSVQGGTRARQTETETPKCRYLTWHIHATSASSLTSTRARRPRPSVSC